MSDKISKKSKTITIDLDFPFEWEGDNGEELIKSVELSRPKGKHLKNIGKEVSMHDLFKIAAKIATAKYVTPAFFDEMDASDCMKVVEVIGDFLDGGRGIGETA